MGNHSRRQEDAKLPGFSGACYAMMKIRSKEAIMDLEGLAPKQKERLIACKIPDDIDDV